MKKKPLPKRSTPRKPAAKRRTLSCSEIVGVIPHTDHPDTLLTNVPKLDTEHMIYLRMHLHMPRTKLAEKLGIRKIHLLQIMQREGIMREVRV